ncbi:Repeat-companion domain protein OS=Isosphaera pallida (strain ATCC 43644 / DSM 9630 / IS1B) GN=Isop_0537 PE=4 SV=1 [Gemmata massiliana]|uniref:Repeat-companion domain protein n=1 Tax=Gemmata massiliana TaxID=1210884 RepID=A0A6P2D7Q3_9BACT|nr:TIGR02996 domain-containing protein [Gemmata massiliana]VTR97179.1 Repeat-companion domain protein OS=Isosphaera pallida (strain ATCC 43644 / DSM 9630 / IS1B) GN=Isop_0537 PE=4 SV=1 [Gemmata massiliana]
MDLLSQHEAFLRAIFDAPDDDTPRLVYADFLQEQGDEDRAEFIRVQCELALKPWDESTDRVRRLVTRERELSVRLFPDGAPCECVYSGEIDRSPVRGFGLSGATFVVTDAVLADPGRGRWRIVRSAPALFGANALVTGVLLRPEYFEVLFALPVAQRITGWTLSGHVREELSHSGPGAFDLIDMVQQPVITTAGVEALARHKSARRITELDLRNNNLDNDAARVLVQSPYLDNLKRLQLLEGNRFRGKVWQQVIERFGEDVVG